MKLKVWVTDEDGWWSGDDDVDGLVQLLRLTPSRSHSTASWTTITVRGQRPSYKTRSVIMTDCFHASAHREALRLRVVRPSLRACVRSWHSPTGLPSTSSSFLTQFITFIPHTRIGRIHVRQSTLLFTHLGSSLPSFISYHFYHLSLFRLQNQSFLIFFSTIDFWYHTKGIRDITWALGIRLIS